MKKKSSASSQPEKLVRVKAADIFNKPLTRKEKARLQRLRDMPDSEIDFSDIPELTAEQLAAMRPGRDMPYYRGRCIVLTAELHRYCCAVADRKHMSINTLVNDVLAKQVSHSSRR
jgi:hypothetical protein